MIEVYLSGSLEPVLLDEPREATLVNLTAALQQNQRFFGGRSPDGQLEAIAVDYVTRIREVAAE